MRDVVFQKLTDEVNVIIQESSVIAVTLDKVTTSSTSFTVLLTYFFFQGKISVVLNEIYAMHTDELDGEGTADLVINCLQKTLGLSLEDISENSNMWSLMACMKRQKTKPGVEEV